MACFSPNWGENEGKLLFLPFTKLGVTSLKISDPSSVTTSYININYAMSQGWLGSNDDPRK